MFYAPPPADCLTCLTFEKNLLAQTILMIFLVVIRISVGGESLDGADDLFRLPHESLSQEKENAFPNDCKHVKAPCTVIDSAPSFRFASMTVDSRSF